MFKPFPIGTIRGPFVCGYDGRKTGGIMGHEEGIQYAVQSENGWCYFIGPRRDVFKLRQKAEEFSKSLTSLKG